MAKAESCYGCVYSRWDRNLAVWTMSLGVPTRPACANQPDCPGRWKQCPLGRICDNFRVRPPTPGGEAVKTISLGGGFITYVDAADFDWLSQWTWYLNSGYAVRREKNRVISMHRQIMQPPKGLVVHHKNRNKLDNTRENMENTTQAENMRDRSKPRNCSSRFWGVSYTKQRAKYQASVHYKGKAVACGWFTDEVEAARAHDCKAVELKGELARLNFPDEWPPERRAAVYATPEAESARRKAARPRTRDARRKTKSPRATGHRTRATRKKAMTRRGDACVARRRKAEKGEKRKRTRVKPVKPQATKSKRVTGHRSRDTASG